MRTALTALWISIAGAIAAGGEGATVPQGPGLAARFPFDRGIGSDPRVLLHEDFEGALSQIKSHWTNVSDKGNQVLSVSQDVPPASGGRQSLLMTSTKGHDTGGHLWKCFKQGVDQMYARYYVKFANDHPYNHHFTKIGAWRGASRWPAGEAGYKHDGSKSFQTGLEPGSGWGRNDPPGAWFLYTYWCEMRGSPPHTGRCHWGNTFVRDPELKIQKGKWICVEQMMKVNDVGDTNGEQALWIDGKLWRKNGQVVSHQGKGFPVGTWIHDKFVTSGRYNRDPKPFEGYRWRKVEALNVNFVWIYLYITKAPAGYVSKVSYDDVVVARKYIGPLATKRAAPPKPKSEAGGAKAPDDPDAEKAKAVNQKAAKMFRSARGAERAGMKAIAKQLYERIVREYPDSEIAEQAKKRLARL